jgi:hypothetical protein
LKDPTHTLELVEYVDALLFVGVGDEGEVWALDFNPGWGGGGRMQGGKEDQ